MTSKPTLQTKAPGRFDYVAYDFDAASTQASFKRVCESLEQDINANLTAPDYKTLALRKLEECYMYIGKAIRDDQVARNGAAKLQEGRSNS
jgi:hypothetical protein